MRSKNMQVLTDQVKTARPGVTIYGVGDDAHKTRVSGHNEDDTPGVRAEDQDADNIPEHRALDFMIGSHFTKADAKALAADLSSDSENRKRLLYVIFDGKIWSRSRDWEERDYDGDDPHTDHVHASGEADDDENQKQWNLLRLTSGHAPAHSTSDKLVEDGVLGPKTIAKWQKVMGTPVDGKISEDSKLVQKVQERLRQTVDHRLVVDGDGNSFDVGVFRKTIAALQRYLGSPVDGVISTPKSAVIVALQRRLNENRF